MGVDVQKEIYAALNELQIILSPDAEARNLSGKVIRIGDIVDEGTVIGFYYDGTDLCCVAHDETKEGKEAITTFICEEL